MNRIFNEENFFYC